MTDKKYHENILQLYQRQQVARQLVAGQQVATACCGDRSLQQFAFCVIKKVVENRCRHNRISR